MSLVEQVMMYALIVLPTLAVFETHIYYDCYIASIRHGHQWWPNTWSYAVLNARPYGETDGSSTDRGRYWSVLQTSMAAIAWIPLIVCALVVRWAALRTDHDPGYVSGVLLAVSTQLQETISVKVSVAGLPSLLIGYLVASWLQGNRGWNLAKRTCIQMWSHRVFILVVMVAVFAISFAAWLVGQTAPREFPSLAYAIVRWSKAVSLSSIFYVAYVLGGLLWVLPALSQPGPQSWQLRMEFLGNLVKDGIVFFMLFEIVFVGMFTLVTGTSKGGDAPIVHLGGGSLGLGVVFAVLSLLASAAIVAEHWNITRYGFGSPTGHIIQMHVWIRDWLCMVVPMISLLVWALIGYARHASQATGLSGDPLWWRTPLWLFPLVLGGLWPFSWWIERRVASAGPSAPPREANANSTVSDVATPARSESRAQTERQEASVPSATDRGDGGSE
ncbi:MAG: hypothetical protein HUU17_06905 [Chthonomonadales bacterium]|nr:hypothetical protein [Chthonomonadales bacterium]